MELKAEDDGEGETTKSASDDKGTKLVCVQPHIDSAVRSQAETAYRKLITSAYLLAADGQPLSTFKTIVSSLKANGVKLIDGCDNSKKAKQFIHHLANAVRVKIGSILNDSTAFGILCDGTRARKTGSEKELVMVRVVHNGEAKYYTVALKNMDQYGSANADNLKKAIDDVFTGAVPVHEYTKKMISVTADGASVNTGRLNGLFSKLTGDDRPWLVGIHCVLHRLELAIGGTLLKQRQFTTVKDIMILLFTLTKQSGSFQRHLSDTARQFGVRAYKFPKVHGSRFVNHQRRGLEVLLHNWIPLLIAIQTAVTDKRFKNIQPKLTGIRKQLANVRILSSACLFKVILDIVAHLSLKFEENKLLVFDVQPAFETALNDMEELLDSPESPIETAGMTLLDNVLQRKMLKSGEKRKKVDDREFVTLEFSFMTNAGQSGPTISALKKAVVPSIISCVKDRFSSFHDAIFRSMHWIDPANWREDGDNEMKSINVSDRNTLRKS